MFGDCFVLTLPVIPIFRPLFFLFFRNLVLKVLISFPLSIINIILGEQTVQFA